MSCCRALSTGALRAESDAANADNAGLFGFFLLLGCLSGDEPSDSASSEARTGSGHLESASCVRERMPCVGTDGDGCEGAEADAICRMMSAKP